VFGENGKLIYLNTYGVGTYRGFDDHNSVNKAQFKYFQMFPTEELRLAHRMSDFIEDYQCNTVYVFEEFSKLLRKVKDFGKKLTTDARGELMLARLVALLYYNAFLPDLFPNMPIDWEEHLKRNKMLGYRLMNRYKKITDEEMTGRIKKVIGQKRGVQAINIIRAFTLINPMNTHTGNVLRMVVRNEGTSPSDRAKLGDNPMMLMNMQKGSQENTMLTPMWALNSGRVESRMAIPMLQAAMNEVQGQSKEEKGLSIMPLMVGDRGDDMLPMMMSMGEGQNKEKMMQMMMTNRDGRYQDMLPMLMAMGDEKKDGQNAQNAQNP
jgi:hypothetical protein